MLHSNPDRKHTPEHDCLQEINNISLARPDLESTPFDTGRHIYVDGSCSKPADNVYLCGYAVCELPNTVHEAFSLPYMSAQAAELVALFRACEMFPGETLTGYGSNGVSKRLMLKF